MAVELVVEAGRVGDETAVNPIEGEPGRVQGRDALAAGGKDAGGLTS